MRFAYLTESKPAAATTKDGRRIEFQYFEQEQHGFAISKAHWRVHEVQAFIDGKNIGFAKVSYIDKRTLDAMSVWEVMREKGHVGLGPREGEGSGIGGRRTEDDVFEKWSGAHFLTHIAPKSRSHLPNGSWNPGDVSDLRGGHPPVETMLADLDELEKKIDYKREEFRKQNLVLINKPFLEYIFVEEPYRRLGIATALIDAAARWMAERGMYLRSGAHPYGNEQALWTSIERSGKYPIRDGKKLGRPTKIMDYRAKKNPGKKSAR